MVSSFSQPPCKSSVCVQENLDKKNVKWTLCKILGAIQTSYPVQILNLQQLVFPSCSILFSNKSTNSKHTTRLEVWFNFNSVFNPNLGGNISTHHPSLFSFNKSEMVKAVILAFCSIKQLFIRDIHINIGIPNSLQSPHIGQNSDGIFSFRISCQIPDKQQLS